MKNNLPTDSSDLFLTDGGLETTLVFLEGFDLPCFAAFDLLKDESGYTALRNYYRRYLSIAAHYGTGFILESPTWRANPDWIKTIGYPDSALREVNRKAVQLLVEVKSEFLENVHNILLSGCVGPRGDGYKAENTMTAAEAQIYHSAQIAVLGQTPVDLISAITMTYPEEAIGITLAVAEVGLPAVISFTVETDGTLPNGMRLKEAIEQVESHSSPLYYMINCAHPSHFMQSLQEGKNEAWTSKIRGVRTNASCKSHAELDEATELDRGNPEALGGENKNLKNAFPLMNVFGGCCGTDEEYISAMAAELTADYAKLH
jgi:S-methylmethionine-dependent homocysteine/selenocysteine methylase